MAAENKFNQRYLRITALIFLFLGAIGSLYFMHEAGSNQKSIILISLFTIWVTSPFAGLFFASQLTKRWTAKAQSWFYTTMFILTIVSLIIYSRVLIMTETKPAFNFLIVPFLSWLVILTILIIAKRQNLKK